MTDDELICAAWPAAVGRAIARHTSRVRLARTTLIVEVEDAIWQRQLRTLASQILARLHKLTGQYTIDYIDFRVGVPRREPQRAMSHQTSYQTGAGPLFAARENTAPTIRGEDEADRIQDPVLKKVYQLSRRKASA